MSSERTLQSNFAHLKEHDEQLLRVGMLAERYFTDDPNTCLLKLRQLAELLAQSTASAVGLLIRAEETQCDLLARLRDDGVLPREIHQLFTQLRRTGNAATHEVKGDHHTALAMLRIAWQVSLWFHRTFKAPSFKSGPFIPPRSPQDPTEGLRTQLAEMAKALAERQEESVEKSQQLSELTARLRTASDERSFWEQMALEVEAEKNALKQRINDQQVAAANQAKAAQSAKLKAVSSAAVSAAQKVNLSESETRALIDQQLRDAGWLADSEQLRFSRGVRPEKGKNLAIAEWPTATGPADYVLFVGLTPMAVVEAKRRNVDISSALQQAKRYSRGFEPCPELLMHPQNWGAEREFKIPFVYSTNGRPYLRQLATQSGVWFCDLRRPSNLAEALQGWHSPEGLVALLKRDEEAAHQQLATEGFAYGFSVRYYQQNAIQAVERAISTGQRSVLLAMATGTGKTKTCIALIYRLLKTKRFRRILFLVDRSALGEQAANSFKETRMESLQTFADIFGIKELDEISPDSDTAVHLATVQGMVSRVLYPSENTLPPTVDQYDCIVVDECHRGYLLDREMSDVELRVRDQNDYISMYRRVIDYFDAVKIGLTATPALHTTEIFGAPIYTYSYREAVIDGYLIDYEPPFRIQTQLSTEGIVWKKDAEVSVLKPDSGEIELFRTPDEIKFEVEQFNTKVITKSFNETVCAYLAQELDPNSKQKTLIFCATDAHADLVVTLLKQAFANVYGSVDDDAVLKITGTADQPLKLIRRFKNEFHPNVAVTVDLLTTGIDVPEICNLVFLRRVNSRILFDQMLGRATRLCEEIGKESFRIFDAVRLYEALKDVTAMKPVAVNPSITFSQLVREISAVPTDDDRRFSRDQFIAKFQRKKRHLSEETSRDFETLTGHSIDDFAAHLRQMPLDAVAAWFTERGDLGEILDRRQDGPRAPQLVSEHADSLVGVTRGYGSAVKPDDYLQAFAEFIKSKSNDIPAIVTVVTRPRELTRTQLRLLMLELDKAGYSEANLHAAWHHKTNQEIAARIIGYIRQAALGDPLVPFAKRVDHALAAMLASRPWTAPQREWLKKLAAQTKANQLVDRSALDDPDLIFKREGGGFARLNKLFGGQLDQLVLEFNDAVWRNPA